MIEKGASKKKQYLYKQFLKVLEYAKGENGICKFCWREWDDHDSECPLDVHNYY